MKVTKTPVFSPISILLETEEELKAFKDILSYAYITHCRNFASLDNVPALLTSLQEQIRIESNKTF